MLLKSLGMAEHVFIPSPKIKPARLGFISTRFAGTDGVSLEAAKWAKVLEQDGHSCFWYSGRSDKEPENSVCIPEAFFGHPECEWISKQVWGKARRSPLTTERIYSMAEYLKETLYNFVHRFDLQILIIENVLSIPMHIPLGVAMTHFLAESHLPCIGHHHDFYWERSRFALNAVNDILDMSFPSRDHDLQHVVINQAAQEELAHRKGISSMLIPNVFDFEKPPIVVDDYAADFRQSIGLADDDRIILQPTRVVPRKGIEHSINLVKMLADSRYKLIVTHDAGDEGFAYRSMLISYAKQLGVDMRFIATRIGDWRGLSRAGEKIYTLWDIYPQADLVTYPSLYEGFGNAFLEALYFKIPILVNRYSIFGRDIEPKKFNVPIMDGFLTDELVAEVRRLIEDKEYRKIVVEHNYSVAASYYSYSILRRNLRTLISNISGMYNL